MAQFGAENGSAGSSTSTTGRRRDDDRLNIETGRRSGPRSSMIRAVESTRMTTGFGRSSPGGTVSRAMMAARRGQTALSSTIFSFTTRSFLLQAHWSCSAWPGYSALGDAADKLKRATTARNNHGRPIGRPSFVTVWRGRAGRGDRSRARPQFASSVSRSRMPTVLSVWCTCRPRLYS